MPSSWMFVEKWNLMKYLIDDREWPRESERGSDGTKKKIKCHRTIEKLSWSLWNELKSIGWNFIRYWMASKILGRFHQFRKRAAAKVECTRGVEWTNTMAKNYVMRRTKTERCTFQPMSLDGGKENLVNWIDSKPCNIYKQFNNWNQTKI